MWFSPWKRRQSRRTADSHRVRPCLESLEERVVPSAMTVVYTESNNPARAERGTRVPPKLQWQSHGDRLVQHRRHWPDQHAPDLGPAYSSTEVLATPDGRFLFAVNQGSNSVSAFRIEGGGAST